MRFSINLNKRNKNHSYKHTDTLYKIIHIILWMLDLVNFLYPIRFGEHISNLKDFKTLKTDSIYPCSNCDKNTEHSLLIKRISDIYSLNKFANNETLGPVFEQSGSLENLLDCYKIEHHFYFIGGFRYRTHYKCYKMESDVFVGHKQTIEREDEDLNSGNCLRHKYIVLTNLFSRMHFAFGVSR